MILYYPVQSGNNRTSETLRNNIDFNTFIQKVYSINHYNVPTIGWYISTFINDIISYLYFIINATDSNHLHNEYNNNNHYKIKNISIHVPKHLKPLNDNQFGHYLAGLIDGKGNFNISKNKQIDICDSNDISLNIMFDYLDLKLAYYIKSYIGYGQVKKVKSTIDNKNTYIFIITNKKGIIKVLNLINGKIRSINIYNQIINNILTPTQSTGINDYYYKYIATDDYNDIDITNNNIFTINKTNDFNNY